MHQDHRCSSLLHAFNTGAVQKFRRGHTGQRTVSKFLTAECASQRLVDLRRVYGEDAIDGVI